MIDMVSSYSIVYSSAARRELVKIHEYITEKFCAPETAGIQVSRIVRAVKTLSVFPKMYRVRRKSTGMRICPVDSYLILYSVDDDNRTVNVSHIIYSRRNLDALI